MNEERTKFEKCLEHPAVVIAGVLGLALGVYTITADPPDHLTLVGFGLMLGIPMFILSLPLATFIFIWRKVFG